MTMHSSYRRKPVSRRNIRYSSTNNSDTRNNYRNQDSYSGDRWKVLSDTSLYNIARFLMGNEVQIITRNNRIEGVLRSFGSSSVCLSKVLVYDSNINETIPLMKEMLDGKEVPWKDIFMIKLLSNNGKTENVLVDHEISQRKQINKTVSPEDKNLVPYFDDDESQLHDKTKEDDFDIGLKGDQCWYNPEDMLKDNEEKFNVKNTFSVNMEEYTTQIDTSDPLLLEKYELAEKLAWEMENDPSLRRAKQLENDEEESDDESKFCAVVSTETCSSLKQEILVKAVASIRLNPNAPEFRPRLKPDNIVEEMPMVTLESIQQQQQQHQQMMQRIMQMSLAHQTQSAVSQVTQQAYPIVNQQRLVSAGPGQWTTIPLHQQQQQPPSLAQHQSQNQHHQHNNQTPSLGQYVIQQYIPHQAQLMPPVFQTRQMSSVTAVPQLDPGQSAATGVVFYSPGPLTGQFFMQPSSDPHLSATISGPGADWGQPHMYSAVMDPVTLQQLRQQSHLVPTNIPVLQSAAGSAVPGHMSLHPHQILAPPPPSAAVATQQQGLVASQPAPSLVTNHHHITGYYTQSPHQLLATHQHLSQQQQQAQLQASTNLQNYITNGRS